MTRQLFVTGPRQLEIIEQPESPIQPGFVRIKTVYLGISAGTELNTYRAGVNWYTGRNPQTRIFSKDPADHVWKYPAPIGYANVGRIVATAGDVGGFKVGQMVFSFGTHATFVDMDHRHIHLVPEDHDPRVYTFHALIRTALNICLHARPSLGEDVVMFGMGPVGLLTLQLVRMSGAGRIIVFDPIPKRRELALEMGADVALDSTGDDPASMVRAITGPTGADIAIECSGHPDALRDSPRVVGLQARVVIGSMPGRPIEFPFGQETHFNGIQMTGANVMRLPRDLYPRWDLDRRDAISRTLIPKMKLAKLITHEVPFDQAADGFKILDTRASEVVSMILLCGE